MRRGFCRIIGAQLMEGSFRATDHPHGPALEVSFAYVTDIQGKPSPCGKVGYASPGTLTEWPPRVQQAFLSLVDALEDAFITDSELFLPEDSTHAEPERLAAGGEPEEF